ncbi:hypothetical protein GSI_03185 [Ganoderma sinense ZZ0214-1]|uniref:F-box domain-containing protein n=1 Tax=Ganoderma sinense ZZ0214-1 TaxID=1077348 RepID=A0A2G8SKX8_9APHY|nr:hypothetical protein GSI_03185 [Ganoderma sinense ZZ0214-1]
MATQQLPGHASNKKGRFHADIQAHKRGRSVSDPPPSPSSTRAPVELASKRRRKRNILENLPTDVLLKVASWVHPLALLHLARTSKSLRETLLARNSLEAWQNSISVVEGLPACPRDMSEPAYVALVFDKCCFLCESAHASHWVDFAIRIRLCKPCFNKNIKPATEFIDDLSRYALGLNFIPCVGGDVRYEAEFLKGPHVQHRIDFCYYVRDVEEMMVQFDHHYLGEDTARQMRLTSDMKARYSHAVDILKFMERRKAENAQESNLVKEKRISDIESRLIKLGHKEQSFPRNHPEWCRLVRQSKPLTDRIWQNLLPKLQRLIEASGGGKDEAELKERIEVRMDAIVLHYRTFTSTRPEEERRLMPSLLDAPLLPSLIALASENNAQEQAVSYDDLADISGRVLDDVETYKAGVQRALVALLAATSPTIAADLAGLDPATALRRYPAAFWCRKACETRRARWQAYMTYEDVYAHWRILHSAAFMSASERPGPEPELALANVDKPHRRVGVPTLGTFSFPEIAREMLLAMGIPLDTEREILDAWVEDGQLFCGCGSPDSKITTIFRGVAVPINACPEPTGWMQLVAHVMYHTWLYHGRKELMRKNGFPLPDLPIEDEPFLYECHPLSHGDPAKCVLKFIPEGPGMAPAASRRLEITDPGPARFTEIHKRLSTTPEDSPRAVMVCGVCLTMVGLTTVNDRREVKKNLRLLRLTAFEWQWHMSVW